MKNVDHEITICENHLKEEKEKHNKFKVLKKTLAL